MKRVVLLLAIASLLGCGGGDPSGLNGPDILQPTELCADYAATAIATFADARLDARVRAALDIGVRGSSRAAWSRG